MVSLEQIRTRLLDLTGRNRLLNFSHNRAGCVRVIDELPDQLANEFLKGEPVSFLPLAEPQCEDLVTHQFIKLDEQGNEVAIKPLPTASQWAQLNGLNSDFDVPNVTDSRAQKHNDRKLQTLLYPRQLESQLRSMRSNAISAIEETGTNVLFLAIGFLQWLDKDNNDAKRLAPLYLIPVKIERGVFLDNLGTFSYQLSYTSEDIVANLSLREKLSQEYGLQLPDLDYDSLPEDYFSKVNEQILQRQPSWQIRRFVSLSMFDFGKLLMYLDLDAAKWPQGPANITNHPSVRAMFGQSDEQRNGENQRQTEYDIDAIEDAVLRYPLIDDADSSQHSAMIDALDGKNLVIEGPPGTGKSQTITNLIAAAISRGQSVLFVAEKMAALQVVQSRMAKAGLADFCLELHSLKTQKKLVFESLSKRIETTDSHKISKTLEQDIFDYHEVRTKLSDYVELVNLQWQDSGLTIAEVLNSAAQLPTQYSWLEWQQLDLSTLAAQPSAILTVHKALENYADILSNIKTQLGDKPLNHHPWYGAYNAQLSAEQQQGVFESLERWQQSLVTLGQKLPPINQQLAQFGLIESLNDIESACNSLAMNVVVQGNEIPQVLQQLDDDNQKVLVSYLSTYAAGRAEYQRLRNQLNETLLQDASALSRTRQGLDILKQQLVEPDISIYAVVELVKQLRALHNTVVHIEQSLNRVLAEQGDLSPLLAVSGQGLQTFERYLQFYHELKPSLVALRSEIFEQDSLDDHLPTLTDLLSRAQPLKQQLKDVYDLERLLPLADLQQIELILIDAGLFKWFSSDWRKARKALLGTAKGFSPDLAQLQATLPQLIEYRKCIEALENEDAYGALLGQHYKGVDSAIDDINALRQWYCQVRSCFGIGFGEKVALAEALFSTPVSMFKGLAVIAQSGVLKSLEQWRLMSTQLAERVNLPFVVDQRLALLDGVNSITYVADKLENELKQLQSGLKSDIALNVLDAQLQSVSDNQALALKLKDDAASKALLGETFSLSFEDADVVTANRLEETLQLDKAIATLPNKVIGTALRHNATISFLDSLKPMLEPLKHVFDEQRAAMVPFADLVGLDMADWLEGYDPKVTALIKKNAKALDQRPWLVSWLDFLRIRTPLAEQGLERLIRWCESDKIQFDQLLPLYQAILCEHWARDILAQFSQLAHFSSAEHDAAGQQFIAIDEKLKKLMRQWVAAQAIQHGNESIEQGVSGTKVSELTQMKLIHNEVKKKIRHISIRQLLKRAGKSVKALKPCFLMSPHSVAQYLTPGEFEFDLVVMDEASQIKPEDALATIARGKQLVVVGDPKQLPPSSFFEKTVDQTDDDVTQVEQAESILDISALLFETARLRWHYRSRHESLIAFSNQHFYQNDLVLFPSPRGMSDSFGVKFNYISHGRFHQQRNLEEAKTVAESVRNHLLHHPSESLGVVAMSATQKGLIEREIESLSKQDKAFRDVLIANNDMEEPLFVKNLENVQGDERSVIFISFTYGPQDNEAEQMPQRFGPINSASGDRRLNVLFTRAKKRMHIFSSMNEGHVLPKATSSKGVHLLKAFLTYAAQEKYERTLSASEARLSTFQSSLGNALNKAGYEYVSNLGVAGYFVEIAVIDPNHPEQFLLAIETDGANYYSGKTVRDRDRLRQSVLKRLGWEVIRVWSAQWYKNADSQLTYILERLEQLTQRSCELQIEASSEVAEIDDVVQKDKADHQFIAAIVQSHDSLAKKLERFAREVIDIELPAATEREKLLRPSMIETLCSLRPLSRSEFMAVVPVYLLQATSDEQLKFIDPVLGVIGQCEAD